MSKISRIRILNLGYNHDTIKIDDETFDFGGESTLISLRNGGGKSVLVQMIMSQFVNKSCRDLGDRQFKSYFTTNRPTFIMTEWQLDNKVGRFLSGMMVRKSQKEDNDIEELEIFTFTGSYSQPCRYDIDNIPIIKFDGNRKMLKGFSECKNIFEDISKDRNGDFRIYDMGSRYGKNQYFATLRQYQINNKEWESIIRRVNQKESGLSELFSNSKDEKDLVENWFLRSIEDKLNQDKNRIDEFRNLSLKFIEQYKSNQSKIERKAVIEKYFEDTKKLKENIDKYALISSKKREHMAIVIAYIDKLQKTISELADNLEERKCGLADIKKTINHIIYEQISYQIYEYIDRKDDAAGKLVEQEVVRTGIDIELKKLSKQLNIYDCNKIYLEIKEYKTEKAEVDEKVDMLLQKSDNNRGEIERLGHKLYDCYIKELENNSNIYNKNGEEIKNTEAELKNLVAKKTEYDKQIRKMSTEKGILQSSVTAYDEIEEAFNTDYLCSLKRNILGFYEEGVLAVRKKEMDAEKQQEVNNLARLSRKKRELEIQRKSVEQEEIKNNEQINNISHEINKEADTLTELETQKNYRLKIIKYINLKDEYIDRQDTIIENLSAKINELDIDKINLIATRQKIINQYEQLKGGKIIEIPDNIRNYCVKNDINYIYGMEWLKKNGRSQEEKLGLINKNPFIPYSVIMERGTFEHFRKIDEKFYTGFPIPIIIRDELEKNADNTEHNIVTYGNVHFYIMFNEHLLNKAELERMLQEQKKTIDELNDRIHAKTEDIDIFNKYKNDINNQIYSKSLYEITENKIKEYKEQINDIKRRQQQIRDEKASIDETDKQVNNSCVLSENNIRKYENRLKEYEKLCRKYSLYEVNLNSLMRITKEIDEYEKKYAETEYAIEEKRNAVLSLKSVKIKLEEIIAGLNSKKEEFSVYSKEEYSKEDYSYDDILTGELEAKYNALTKEVSDTIDELKVRQKRLSDRIVSKQHELRKKNIDNISEAEYRDAVYSQEQYDELEIKIRKQQYLLNAANEENSRLNKIIGSLNKDIEYSLKELKEKTEYDEIIERKLITDIDFNRRINLKKYEFTVISSEIEKITDRNNALSVRLSGISEYSDITPEVSNDKMKEISDSIPDLKTIDNAALDRYQTGLKKELAVLQEKLNKNYNEISEEIRTIAGQKEYADDYFQKPFASLLMRVGNPENLIKQYDVNISSYESQLEKLKIDLANIDGEQKNIEEMFIEYIKNINDNISMIDRNSTINVRGRNIKMLRIYVPDWDCEKEHYKIQLHDYFEKIIKRGIEVIDNNKNLSDLLGKTISTKNLYDYVVGINNIKIKLYKIEAEKEVPISWTEVSSNSGGEGFLSAFVVLTCLLSYMRRDESDLFTTSEEGKVLIMDNPFAQTYSAHLLKPLMEMAKKTNTQLICLSGLGGDSIYNRFDNIYVLKLVDSNIRKGIQRVESEHIKGEDVKKMVLSEFRTEQISMFDMVEE